MVKFIKELPMYKMSISDENDGTFAISLVKSPAIKSKYIALAEQKTKVVLATTDEDKRLVLGAILIPDQPIYRDIDGEKFYISFDVDTVKESSELYLKNAYQKNATVQHHSVIDGVTLVESWIVEHAEMDKSKFYELEIPVGSWAGTMKIDNDEIWNKYIKTGELQGFSVEGLYTRTLIQNNDMGDDETIEKILELLK